ncbi:cobyric acid synthase CobQ, partial [Nocardia farcinica]|nr:cobyric acid synthase CobQ [Nocardia farcinica]
GGYQMLGRRIVDEVESGAGEVAGLGVFDLETAVAAPPVLRRVPGVGAGTPVRGYELHPGRVRRSGDAPWLGLVDAPEAAVAGGEAAGPRAPEGSV